MVPSSANFRIEIPGLSVRSTRKSCKNILKRTGDSAEPWGRPYSEHCLSLPSVPLMFNLTFLVNRKLLMSCAICPVIPR